MLTLLVDVNAEGHVNALLSVCRGAAWRDIWDDLGVRVYRVEEFGLSREATDREIWKACQRRGAVLVTAN